MVRNQKHLELLGYDTVSAEGSVCILHARAWLCSVTSGHSDRLMPLFDWFILSCTSLNILNITFPLLVNLGKLIFSQLQL